LVKKTKPTTPAAPPPAVLGMPAVGLPAAINPLAPGFGFAEPITALEPRKILKAEQRSSEFHLDDGTVLTIRPVLIDVKRAKDQWGINGKPIYVMTLTNVTETESPAKLMDQRFAASTKARTKKSERREAANDHQPQNSVDASNCLAGAFRADRQPRDKQPGRADHCQQLRRLQR
jgi:hypothetical protein